MFVPVYTLTGWFESYPLFFFLLSLYLLLRGRPYLSAFFTGVGFMIKLIPLILMPVALQLLARYRYSLTFQGLKPLVTKDEPAEVKTEKAGLQFLIPFDLPRASPMAGGRR